MAETMRLQIITPDRSICDEPVKMVEMRTAEGEIGVLPGHIPVTIMMVPGIVHITTEEGKKHAAVHDGFVEIQPDGVSIMAEMAEWPEDIDLTRAENSMARAQQRLAQAGEEIDLPRAARSLERAKTRIELKTREWS